MSFPHRNFLKSCLVAALAAAPLAFSCEEDHPDGITASGVVIEEQYVPATSRSTSQYFFFLEKPAGRQAVEVSDYYENGYGCDGDYQSKESLDFLIAPGGSRVEISGLTPEELSQDIWQVEANRIRVYQLEE